MNYWNMSIYLCAKLCVFIQLNFNCLEMGQSWHDLLCIFNWMFNHLNYLCYLSCVHSTIIPCQILLLCIIIAVCIWLGAKCDEWGCECECLNEWMNALIINCISMWWMWWINGMNDCVIGIYFSILLVYSQPFDINVMYDWCEWVIEIYF